MTNNYTIFNTTLICRYNTKIFEKIFEKIQDVYLNAIFRESGIHPNRYLIAFGNCAKYETSRTNAFQYLFCILYTHTHK